MQKLYTLIFLSIFISCGKQVSKDIKPLKSMDIDGDHLLETSSNDYIAALPKLDFKISYIKNKNNYIQENKLLVNNRYSQVLKEIGSQNKKNTIESSRLELYPSTTFTMLEDIDKKSFKFRIFNNKSEQSVSEVRLKVSLDDSIGIYEYLTLTNDQFRKSEFIDLDLSKFTNYLKEGSRLRISVEDFYFKRKDNQYTFSTFLSNLMLKNYHLTILTRNSSQHYFISKTKSLHDALKLLRYNPIVDTNSVIRKFLGNENKHSLDEIRNLKDGTSFWLLTNIAGQSLSTVPRSGSHISLINFSKSDFVKFGYRQELLHRDYSHKNQLSFTNHNDYHSLEFKSIRGKILIPKQEITTESFNYSTAGDRACGACEMKSQAQRKKCTIKRYKVMYTEMNINNFPEISNQLNKMYFFKDYTNLKMTILRDSQEKIKIGKKTYNCPSYIKSKSIRTKAFSHLFNGEAQIIRRYYY